MHKSKCVSVCFSLSNCLNFEIWNHIWTTLERNCFSFFRQIHIFVTFWFETTHLIWINDIITFEWILSLISNQSFITINKTGFNYTENIVYIRHLLWFLGILSTFLRDFVWDRIQSEWIIIDVFVVVNCLIESCYWFRVWNIVWVTDHFIGSSLLLECQALWVRWAKFLT